MVFGYRPEEEKESRSAMTARARSCASCAKVEENSMNGNAPLAVGPESVSAAAVAEHSQEALVPGS